MLKTFANRIIAVLLLVSRAIEYRFLPINEMEPDALRRGKIVLWTAFFLALLFLMNILRNTIRHGFSTLPPLLIPAMVVCVVALCLIRITGSHFWPALLILFTGCTFPIYGVLYSGHGVHAASARWLAIMPVFAGFMMGWKAVAPIALLCIVEIFIMTRLTTFSLPGVNDDNIPFSSGAVIFIAATLTILFERSRLRANRLKEEFLANITHELRSPLTSILGFSDILIKKTPEGIDERALNYLGRIHGQGRDLLILINDLIDRAKLESNMLEPHFAHFDLARTIREVTSGMNHEMETSRIPVNLDSIPTSLPVNSDEELVRRILMKLVSNAVKFADSQSGRVEIHLRNDMRRIQIAVRDNGKGIKPADLESVFETFVQGDGSVSRKFAGTGLGLAIARRLAHMLGGSLHARSPGKLGGATFRLMLPITPPKNMRSGEF